MFTDNSRTTDRAAIGFSWTGHAVMHVLAGLYPTLVLVLEREWNLPYDELLRLWTLGTLLMGLGAPLGGWLGDRWSESRMLTVFFIISGAGAMIAGAAGGPNELWFGLSLMGLGCSIYHPVGMSMVVRHSIGRGSAMGWFGLTGTVGVAAAALVAGSLADGLGRRAVFLVPGAVSLIVGALLLGAMWIGLVRDRRGGDAEPQAPATRRDVTRAFFILSVTMLCGGLMSVCLQLILPKMVELRLGDQLGAGVLGVGGLVTAVNLAGVIPQLIGGRLADRASLRTIYMGALAAQGAGLAVLSALGGTSALVVASGLVVVMQIQAPAENLLLARYTPDRHRGLIFGAKFILVFGVGPVSVEVCAWFFERFGEFNALFLALAALGIVAALAAWTLPRETRAEAA